MCYGVKRCFALKGYMGRYDVIPRNILSSIKTLTPGPRHYSSGSAFIQLSQPNQDLVTGASKMLAFHTNWAHNSYASLRIIYSFCKMKGEN